MYTQNELLESHLRGTGRTLNATQAAKQFGIKNLRARMSEMRAAGLRVDRTIDSNGLSSYKVSRRDISGSQAAKFA